MAENQMLTAGGRFANGRTVIRMKLHHTRYEIGRARVPTKIFLNIITTVLVPLSLRIEQLFNLPRGAANRGRWGACPPICATPNKIYVIYCSIIFHSPQ